MRKTFYALIASFTLVCVGLFCSCNRNEEEGEPAQVVALNHLPESSVAEAQLGTANYSHDEFLRTTAGEYYIEAAIYDCYREGGEVFYVLNPRESNPENVNQRLGMEGLSTHYIQFYDDYYASTGGMPEYKTTLCNYSFDAAAQTLNGLFTYHSTIDVPHRLVYLHRDYIILEMDAPWRKLSAEKGATFSRVVYTRVDEPTHPVVPDTIDNRR